MPNCTAKAGAPRGYSMLITVVLLTLLGLGAGILLVKIRSSANTTASMSQARRLFYVCDGLSRTVTKVAHDLAANTASTLGSDALLEEVCMEGGGTYTASLAAGGTGTCAPAGSSTSILPSFVPPEYRVTAFTVAVDAAGSVTTALPSGPFEGINAKQTKLTINVGVESASGARCTQKQDLAIAQVGAFQFFVFAEGYIDVAPGASLDILGRVHVNGHFCGSGTNTRIDQLTASGKILYGTNCSDVGKANLGTGTIQFRKGTSGSFGILNGNSDHLCTDCTNSGTPNPSDPPWKEWAVDEWDGNVLDSAHGVTVLKLPISTSAPVQNGRDQSRTVTTNVGTQRLLVDPPQSGDTDEVKAQRLAYKADIRIIDGVWYKRDPSVAYDWPGTPIWSDHPGSAPSSGWVPTALNVGQSDISTARGWTSVPSLYSYYEYDAINKRLFDDPNGVISYGTLFRDTSTTPVSWKPGFRMHHDASESDQSRDPDGWPQNRYCTNSAAGTNDDYEMGDNAMVSALTQACYACTGTNAESAVDRDCEDTSQNEVLANMVNMGIGANLLNATRSGFLDNRIRTDSGSVTAGAVTTDIPAADAAARANILPVNFDVAAFATAMATTTGKELGSYFPATAPFNGIVYVTYTWRGQMDNLTTSTSDTGVPTIWPNPAGVDDRTQAQHHTNHSSDGSHFADNQATTALPWPLCSAGASFGYTGPTTACAAGVGYCSTAERNGFSRPADDGSAVNGFEPYFTVPNCDAGGVLTATDPDTDGDGMKDSLDKSPTTRPNAIRIINAATINHTVFPRGLSIVTNLPVYTLGDMNTGTNWVPALVAGDAVTVLSKSWDDLNSRWAITPSAPTATSTTQKIAVLAGDVPTSSASQGGGLHNFPRYIETWNGTGVTHSIVGSMIIGFRSVFHNQRWNYTYYGPPFRNWQFETNFNDTYFQPPGTPLYNVTATSRWSP